MLGMFGTRIMSENQLLNGYANGITPNLYLYDSENRSFIGTVPKGSNAEYETDRISAPMIDDLIGLIPNEVIDKIELFTAENPADLAAFILIQNASYDFKVLRDGNGFFCHGLDFEDLQVSNAGFGYAIAEAINDYILQL